MKKRESKQQAVGRQTRIEELKLEKQIAPLPPMVIGGLLVVRAGLLAAMKDGDEHRTHYVRRPFHRDPDFGVSSVNYDFAKLLQRAEVSR